MATKASTATSGLNATIIANRPFVGGYSALNTAQSTLT